MASSISERTRRRPAGALALAVAIAAVLMSARGALAQPPPAPTDAVRAAARAKLVEGVDALKRGEHQVALEKFQQAYALVPSPKIHYDFGLAYLGLGRRAEALSAFERFLAEAPDAPPDKRDNATRYATTLRAEVGAPSVVVEGAPVTAPASPPASVTPSAPSASPPPPAPAVTAPITANGAPPSDPGSAEPAPNMRRTVALSLGTAGVVLVGAGVVFGVLAKRESDRVSDASARSRDGNRPTFDPDNESRGQTYETLQIVGLVAGVAGLAAGAVLYATTRGRVAVEPVAGRSVAGANLQVRF